jgi:hypothetical protein
MIDAFRPFVSDIKKYGLHRLRPGGATTAADWIMPCLTVCKIRWFFLYCYFTLNIVVLTLKIDHCLVFISIKFSYLILSYLTSVCKWFIHLLFSNLIMSRFLFLKVKLTYIATEIPENTRKSRMDSNLYSAKKFRKVFINNVRPV